MRKMIVAAAVLAAASGLASCSRTMAGAPAPAAREQDDVAPAADHHLHLASPAFVEALTPTPLPADSSPLPEELGRLLRRRELQSAATPQFVAQLYTADAVIRARRGGGWVGGALNIARALNEYAPGYRLVPVAHEIRGETGYVAGYFARGTRYNATFQLSLRREGGAWRIAVDNTIPVAPAMAPRPATAADAIAELDAAGIRRGVIHSVAYYFAGPEYIGTGDEEAAVRAENDWTSREAAQYPERLVAFCGVNPLKEYAVREIERCAGLPRMVGVKLHFGNSGVSLRNPDHAARLRRLFEAANRRGLAVAAHIEELRDYGRAQAEIFLDQVIPAAPDVPIQIMHMAGAGPFYTADSAFQVFVRAREAGDPRMRNVYVDVASNAVAASPAENLELMARRLRQFGLDHVLFGSDRVTRVSNEDPGTAWRSFRRLPLTEDEFRIVARNLAPYVR